MRTSDELQAVKQGLLGGTIALDELLLHVEPLLMQSLTDSAQRTEAKRIVNGIEKVLFSENEPERTRLLGALLDRAIQLASIQNGTT
jgi:hypothetical protein